MALQTKTISDTASRGHHKFSLKVEENSTSTSGNTSSVTFTFSMTHVTAGYDWSYSNTVPVTWKVSIAGKSYSGNIMSYDGSGSVTLKSDTISVPHNSDGSKSISYSFSVSSISKTYLPGSSSASGSMTLTKIPRKATISSAPNFNDEGSPQITYSNPAGSSVSSLQACIADSGGNILIDYRDISKTGTSYTFSLTSAERTTLRKHITSGSSATVRFYVKTVIGDTTYRSYLSKTLSLVNYTPTLSPTVVDTGSNSTALTGDPNVVIKGFNVMSISSGGAARKNATIKSQKVTCGSKSISSGSGTLSYVDSGTFKFTITDSRGHTTTKTVTKTLIPYVPITCSYKANLNVDGTGKVTASGVCFNGSFGAEDNDLTVEYRYKLASSSTWSQWLAIEDVTWNANNSYTAIATLEGFDYQQAYSVQARAVDKIGNATPNAKTMRALPVFDWGEDSFHHHTAAIVDNGKSFAGFKADGTMANIGWISANDNLILGGGSYPPNNIYLNTVEGGKIYASNDNNSTIYNLLGAAKAMSTSYPMTCTPTAGSGWSNASASASLLGNCLRVSVSATRTEAPLMGNQTNETVMTFKLDSGGKIDSIYRVGFCNDTEGSVASYSAQAAKNSDGTFTVTILLTAMTPYSSAVTTGSKSMNGYFVMPANLKLSAFV